ncbi:ABCC1 [Cordylochernes scorpioides]|uniref:ABCC1 n=1 Tax=Cordylochernes scorpioides TaxID=51811 RepID=A0ABY6K9Z6_9ARAC|nr:ABCC1 [Cordylochernes scorpioides]
MSGDAGCPLYVLNGTFKWGEAPSPVLQDVTLAVPQGELVMVLGSVGSGKSTLLAALVGQADRVEGSVYCQIVRHAGRWQGSVAYLTQQVWLMNATLRDNILFFRPYDQFRYEATVRACALTHDFALLQDGDLTLYGDKGVNLSGGQRQRIGLARAVYQNADVYLLDDPFSAVDAQVSQHIFHHVLGPSGLLRKKVRCRVATDRWTMSAVQTRVVVTHQLVYLPHADKVVFLHAGRVQEAGTFSELLDRRGALAEFLLHCISEMATRDDFQYDLDVVEDIVTKLAVEYNRSELLT